MALLCQVSGLLAHESPEGSHGAERDGVMPQSGSVVLGVAAGGALAVALWGPMVLRALEDDGARQQIELADVAGFTKVGSAGDHIVVVNVLPGEEMFTQEEFEELRPMVGELKLSEGGADPVPGSRHVEAHIYDRQTGMPVTSPMPVIEVVNHSSGQISRIGSVLMHDVIVGEDDVHFGDNVVLPDDANVTVRVLLENGQKVVIDGYVG